LLLKAGTEFRLFDLIYLPGHVEFGGASAMSSEAALARQIEPHRRMTGEERLQIALDLHALSCEVARSFVTHLLLIPETF
jgi:hypothetical protein